MDAMHPRILGTAPMKRHFTLAVSVFLLAALTTGGYAAWLLLQESVYCDRGSFAYWVTISSTIKSVPTPGAIGNPRYYASAGDGPKLPESAVQFRVPSSTPDVPGQLEAWAAGNGYQRRPDGAFVRAASIVSIEIKPEGELLSVTVRENY